MSVKTNIKQQARKYEDNPNQHIEMRRIVNRDEK